MTRSRCICGDAFSSHGNPAHACDAGGYSPSSGDSASRFRLRAELDGDTCDFCVMYHGHTLKEGVNADEFLAYMMRNCDNPGGCRCATVEERAPRPRLVE